ncbi:hypothetical protein ADL12_04230 [Streptomyces regalis]|uniref:DUF1648 domain-containing protein n=2 Tax=Streptomyces regalis TaxID=68262 RepID=A0A0X3VLI1_9ACTN|nr:hypothetical protein ADL12_04230 [Streptomyces regalis]
MVHLRRTALVTVPFAAGAFATAVAFLLLRDSLPARMATHFTLDGTADGFTSPSTALGLYMLAFAMEAVGVLAAIRSAKSALTTTRSLVALACGLAAASTYLFVVTMRASSKTDGKSADLPIHQLGVAVAIGAAVAGAAWLVSHRRT